MATATKKKNRHMPVSKARNAYELLQEIRKIILEEPKRYDQEICLRYRRGKQAPACGTIGCVAGWAVALTTSQGIKARAVSGGIIAEANAILGLKNEWQQDELFSDTAIIHTQPGTEEHARAGAAHIARFMEAHKEQLKAKAV